MNKKTILTEALAGRDDELLAYQINIDNFRLAAERIAATTYPAGPMRAAMQAYATQLHELMLSNQIEQAKSQVIRDVIAAQLENIQCTP